MQNIFQKIARTFFVGMAVMVLLLVGLGEVWLLQNRDKSNDVATATDSRKKEVVLAAAAGQEYGEGMASINQEKLVSDDARPLLIRRYLEKYKSPLAPYSDLIFELSQTYGFDYYWIVAIAQQESNLCKKIPEDSHNCWGYGIHKNGTLRFENYELALRSYVEYLKREYFDKGLTTAELMMRKYCPGSNGSWAFGVNHFIDELETGEF